MPDTTAAIARAHGPAAVRALIAALDSPGERVPAAIALLDLAHGRPLQPLAFDTTGIHIEVNAAAEAASDRPNGEGARAE